MDQLDWEDLRLFRELGANTTFRAAAAKAGISHSTLSRRMDTLEANVGAQLFVRNSRGFRLTQQGQALLSAVGKASDEFDAGLREIAGADQHMHGTIRITLPDFIAYYGLLDQIATFQTRYPAIDLQFDVSYDNADLARREADIAIRLVEIDAYPDSMLFGRKVAQSHASGYASKAYLDAHDLNDPAGGAVWLGWHPDEPQDWIARTPYPHLPARGAFNHAELQHHAARAGLGLSYLPVCIGDADPDLVRLAGMDAIPARDIWIVTHSDLRKAERLRVFRHWLSEALNSVNL